MRDSDYSMELVAERKLSLPKRACSYVSVESECSDLSMMRAFQNTYGDKDSVSSFGNAKREEASGQERSNEEMEEKRSKRKKSHRKKKRSSHRREDDGELDEKEKQEKSPGRMKRSSHRERSEEGDKAELKSSHKKRSASTGDQIEQHMTEEIGSRRPGNRESGHSRGTKNSQSSSDRGEEDSEVLSITSSFLCGDVHEVKERHLTRSTHNRSPFPSNLENEESGSRYHSTLLSRENRVMDPYSLRSPSSPRSPYSPRSRSRFPSILGDEETGTGSNLSRLSRRSRSPFRDELNASNRSRRSPSPFRVHEEAEIYSSSRRSRSPSPFRSRPRSPSPFRSPGIENQNDFYRMRRADPEPANNDHDVESLGEGSLNLEDAVNATNKTAHSSTSLLDELEDSFMDIDFDLLVNHRRSEHPERELVVVLVDEEVARKRRCTPLRCGFRKGFLIACFLIMIVMIMTVFIGAKMEQKRMQSGPTTTELYDTEQVCAVFNRTEPTFATFDTKYDARENGFSVVHCGHCGACSNPDDIYKMSTEKNTVTVMVAECSWKKMGGMSKLEGCLRSKLGFSEPCYDCFVEYASCIYSSCKFTCFTSNLGNGEECVDCKERMCGKQFLSCSGVNRKNLGIIDFIGHDDESEVCRSVEMRWQ